VALMNIHDTGFSAYLASTGWTFKDETITPDRARAMLANNEGNRRRRDRTVARYAATMVAGNWVMSAEPIIVGKTGRLLNGQHRLSAIMASGVAVRALVAYGVDDATFLVLDRGIPRTIADASGLPKKLVEVGRLAAIVMGSRDSITDNDVTAMCDILHDVHHDLMETCNTSSRIFSSVSFRLAACVHMLAGTDSAYVCSLYRHMVLGQLDGLPRIATHIVGQVLAGKWIKSVQGTDAGISTLVRAWDVFDERKADLQKVSVKSEANRLTEIRVILAAAMRASA
jgi:hypothetical protein